MAGTSFYDVYIPQWLSILASLDSIFDKTEAYAKENGKDADAEYAEGRIFEDMRPLAFQVQSVSRIMKLPITLVTGKETGDWESTEKTFADFRALVEKTRQLLKSVTPDELNGRESDVVKPCVLCPPLPARGPTFCYIGNIPGRCALLMT